MRDGRPLEEIVDRVLRAAHERLPFEIGLRRHSAVSLPLRRVGAPADMGAAIDFLLSSQFTTGAVLDCDGGHHIRQYASAATDPMRQAEPAAAASR